MSKGVDNNAHLEEHTFGGVVAHSVSFFRSRRFQARSVKVLSGVTVVIKLKY